VATYEIIVTDVTCYGSLYCVAGWDRLTGQMIRPEPPGAKASDESSRFWNSGYAGPGKTFAMGNVVRLVATGALPDFLFPHATEDRMVDLNTPMNVLQTLDSQGVVAAVAAGVSDSLTAAFNGALWREEKPKLRARVTSAGLIFDLSVPADAARARWKSAGVAALKADVQASKRVHIRTGLSRPMSSQPNECYSQVNGVLFL
jgi:hypothetical protein